MADIDSRARDDALIFLAKIKQRLGDGSNEYKSLVHLLKKFRQEHIRIAHQVIQEAAYLLLGYPDLLDDFIQFLPYAGADPLTVEAIVQQMQKTRSKL